MDFGERNFVANDGEYIARSRLPGFSYRRKFHEDCRSRRKFGRISQRIKRGFLIFMAFNKNLVIKVCGMRDEENIHAVEQLDVDWMGFVFYPESPRYICLLYTSIRPERGLWHKATTNTSCRKSTVNYML